MRIALALLLGALAGCGASRSTAPHAEAPPVVAVLAQDARTFHQTAPCLAAALLVKSKPEGRDALTFTINVWTTPDGRVRLDGNKAGFSGFQALIEPDGRVLVLAGDDVCRDDLETAFADLLGPGAALARLVDELCLGPVPGADQVQESGRVLTATDPATGLPVELTLAPDRLEATQKRWRNAAGTEVLRLDYERYKVFDGLQRPSIARITIPDRPGDYLIRIQTLDVLPAVSDARMALTPPAGAKELPFAEFLQRLGE